MPGVINRTQGFSVTSWKGTADKDNHIYSLLASEPQRANDVMIQLFASMHLPTTNTYLSTQVPVRQFENDNEMFWDIVTSARKNIALVEARDNTGTPITSAEGNPVGVGMEPFYLVTGEDWFAIGEIIWGNYNEKYPMQVMEDPKIEGTNYVYMVQLFGANGVNGIPRERLMPGERLSWAYAPIEDNFSRKVGDIRFSTPISMRNEFSRIRIQHKIGGKEIGKKLSANIPVTKEINGRPVTKTFSRWMLNVTWTLEETFEEYKNNALMRGVSTRLDDGTYSNFGMSGLPNKQGSGLREFQDAGWVQYYNKFSLSLLEKALDTISEGKVDMKNRKYLVSTGEKGLRLVNQAIKNSTAGWTPIYSTNVPSPMTAGPETNYTNGNGVTIRDFMCTHYLSASGLDITFVLDSSKDDAVVNKIMHPAGGTAESYRFDISYAGLEDQPNIQKCVVKDEPDRRGYQWGPFFNPFTGQANNMSASYDEDSAVVHMKSTLGVLCYDTTRLISLVPNILQA